MTRLLETIGFSVLDVRHERMPAKYALAPGGIRLLVRSPWRAAYAVAFALPLVVGAVVGMGDEILVLARRDAGKVPCEPVANLGAQ